MESPMVIGVGVDTYPPKASPDHFQKYEVAAGDITEAAWGDKRTVEIGRQCVAEYLKAPTYYLEKWGSAIQHRLHSQAH